MCNFERKKKNHTTGSNIYRTRIAFHKDFLRVKVFKKQESKVFN